MKKYFLKRAALAASLLTVQLSAPAIDLDLYVNTPSNNTGDLPNVLFVIDNTANWNTAFTNEMSAIRSTLENLPEGAFNIGIMFASETGQGDSGEKGGYVRAAIRPMTKDNKKLYSDLVVSFDKINDKGNGGVSGLQMAEAWAYFSGGTPWAGNNKVKTDYTGNNSGTAQDKLVWGITPGHALASKASGTYLSPVKPGSCAKNYIIYVSNGSNQQNSSADAKTNELLASAAGGGPAGVAAKELIPLSPSGSQSNPADEWARFMRNSSLNITTYAIDVDPSTTGQGPGWTQLLKSMAPGANYVAVTSGDGGIKLKSELNNILSKIQSVNSVFAAVSLPASANVQGAYLNQLYVGMFRPDPDARPRWMGNIKQYQRGTSGLLSDADNINAINSQTGFITECARSFWSPGKGSDTYWSLDPKGKCIGSAEETPLFAKSNAPDGNIVEKGAQAYTLRGILPAARNVKTCASASCTALADFGLATVSQSALGANNLIEQTKLISWAIGANVSGELNKSTLAMRPSVHGDVIHSNPMALNYGSSVVVYYGSNDGMLHAINGNQTANIGLVPPGGELWSFMPPEFFPDIKRLFDNDVDISLTPAVDAPVPDKPVTTKPKPYGVDGPITAYQSGSTAWLYASMRRGGRSLYAFDVSNAAAPTLKWRAGCTGTTDASCSDSTTGIGQTWSSPRPIKAKGFNNGSQPLLLMGGGYDECEDKDVNSCTSTSKGNKVYVLDANTGVVLKVLETDRGVVAEVRGVPGPNGLLNYAYAVDLGGNVYRVNAGNAAPADWTITKIAALGCAGPGTCVSNRKFMFPPSVVLEADNSVSLYLGSGDREKPLGAKYFPRTITVANYFFKIIDRPTDSTWLSSEASANCDGQAVLCMNSLASVGDTDESTEMTCGAAPVAGKKGWYLGMRPTEQIVTGAATRDGGTTFSTHMPAVATSGSCASNLGTVHVYNLNIEGAAPIGSCSAVVSGGGLPPPPEKIDICNNAECSSTTPICIGCSKDSPIELEELAKPPAKGAGSAKRRVYWYIQE